MIPRYNFTTTTEREPGPKTRDMEKLVGREGESVKVKDFQKGMGHESVSGTNIRVPL